MTITIIQTAYRLPMTDSGDLRTFNEGEQHDLTPQHEDYLVRRGIAERGAKRPEATEQPVEADPAPEAEQAADTDHSEESTAG